MRCEIVHVKSRDNLLCDHDKPIHILFIERTSEGEEFCNTELMLTLDEYNAMRTRIMPPILAAPTHYTEEEFDNKYAHLFAE